MACLGTVPVVGMEPGRTGRIGTVAGNGGEVRFRKYRKNLRENCDGVAQVIRALRYLRGTFPGDVGKSQTALTWFCNQRSRMFYQKLGDRNSNRIWCCRGGKPDRRS